MTVHDSHSRHASPASGLARAAVLIDAVELAAALGRESPPVVLAVRSPDQPDAGDRATAPRIPGAIDVSLATDLAAAGPPQAGSRPLPPLSTLQAAARRWGLRQSSDVVVYDHDGGLQAARAWWVLRWAGLRSVRLLDGGFAAWRAAGLPLSRRPGEPKLGDVVLEGGHMREMDAAAAAGMAREGLLLDSRIRQNYEGGPTAPGEPARGHIPGAVNLPAASNLDEAGAFLDPDRLRALYAAAGVAPSRPVGVYCGAGVSAAHDVLALASLGIDAPMYVGSWSAWSADPSRPVERGPDPG